MSKLKVCAYARVSTNSDDQVNSYDNQLYYFNKEIKAKGYEFCGIYADKGLTGTKLVRKEFEFMLYDAGIDVKKLTSDKNDVRNSKKHTVYEISDREPLFNEIWIKNTSRFARNTLSFELIEKLRNKNVYIFFLEQNLNTKDISQDLILKIFQMFDEQDSRDKSSKVKTGIAITTDRDIILTNPRLYGYKYLPKPENRLEIIPKEAKVIKKIFELYAEGYGYRRILNYLEDNIIYTRQGKSFAQNTIRSILQNEKYAGLNPILKYDTGLVFNKKSPTIKDNYKVVQNDKIPAIISEELFYVCRDKRIENTNEGSQKGIYKGTTKYAKMLICGNCHSYYTGNDDKGRKFYNCSNKKKNSVHACNNENISLIKLESLITAEKYNHRVNEIKQRANRCFTNYIAEVESKRDKDTEKEINKLQQEKQELITQIANLIKQSAFATNDDVRNIINEEMEKLVIQKKKIEKEIDNLNNLDENINREILEIKQTMKEIDNIKLKDEYSEEELFEQVYKIFVNDANNIFIYYNVESRIQNILSKYNIIDNEHLMDLRNLFFEEFVGVI